MVERRAGEHDAVEQGHRDTGVDAIGERPQRSIGGRAVEVEDVVDSGVRHRLDERLAVSLEAGVTYDTTFEDWANLVNDFASHRITSLGEFRKNITVDVFNEAGIKALSYNLYRCWVSEYQALPDLDAGANAVAITSIKLEFEWFERDLSVQEAAGPARIG